MNENDKLINYLIFPADNFTLGEIEYFCSEWFCFVYCENAHAILFVPEMYVRYLFGNGDTNIV